MVVQSKLMEILPKHYGCVVFTAVGSVLVNHWMVFNVMRARKKYNVKVLCFVLICAYSVFQPFLSTASTDLDLAQICCANNQFFISSFYHATQLC